MPNGYLHLIRHNTVIKSYDNGTAYVLTDLYVVALDTPQLPPGAYSMERVCDVYEALSIAEKHGYELINKGKE